MPQSGICENTLKAIHFSITQRKAKRESVYAFTYTELPRSLEAIDCYFAGNQLQLYLLQTNVNNIN